MTNAFENLNFENEFGLNVKSFGDRLKRQNFEEYKSKKPGRDDGIKIWKIMVLLLFNETISNNLHPSIKRLFFQQNSSIQNLYQHYISPNSSESEQLCFTRSIDNFRRSYDQFQINNTNQTDRCNISMTQIHEIEKCVNGSIVLPSSIAKVFCEFPEYNFFDTVIENIYNVPECLVLIAPKVKNLMSRFFIQLDEAETDKQICFSFKYCFFNGFELLIAKNCPNLNNFYRQTFNNFLTIFTNISDNYLTKSCPDLYVKD